MEVSLGPCPNSSGRIIVVGKRKLQLPRPGL